MANDETRTPRSGPGSDDEIVGQEGIGFDDDFDEEEDFEEEQLDEEESEPE